MAFTGADHRAELLELGAGQRLEPGQAVGASGARGPRDQKEEGGGGGPAGTKTVALRKGIHLGTENSASESESLKTSESRQISGHRQFWLMGAVDGAVGDVGYVGGVWGGVEVSGL